MGSTFVKRLGKSFIALFTLYFSVASAQSGPQAFNVSGGLFNPNGTPITQNGIDFKIEVRDKNGLCVLYSEEHLDQDLSQSRGAFSLLLGRGTNPANYLDSVNPTSFNFKLFDNSISAPMVSGCSEALTFASGDERSLRIYYSLGAGYVAMNPDVPLTSTPYAMSADSLSGKTISEIILVKQDANTELTQSNVENIFSTTNYPRLSTLLSSIGNINFSGDRITNLAAPVSGTDAANKNYADQYLAGKSVDLTGIGPAMGDGKSLVWDSTAGKWVVGVPVGTDDTKLPLAGGTMQGPLVMSPGVFLQLGQFQSLSNEPALGVNDAGKIWFNSEVKALRVWDGTAARTQAYLDGAGKLDPAWIPVLPAVDGSSLTNVNAVKLQGRAVAATAPNTGEILKWNNGSWSPAADLGITELSGDISASGSGTVAASINSSAVTTVKIADAAVTSAKIAPGYSANLILMTDGTSGMNVRYSTCANEGEILKWTFATGWTCSSITSLAPVTSVAGKTGVVTLNINDIDGWGTAALWNVGTSAQNVLQLDANARIPAVDGGLLTNVSAERLQGRALASTAPTAAQVLAWNSGTSQWEPSTPFTGDFKSDGSVAMSAPMRLPDGAVAAPSLTFAADTNTGIYREGNDRLGVVTNGTERMRFDESGNVGIGTTSPGAPLDVKGAIRLSGSTSGYTGFQPAASAGSTVWTLPSVDGAANQVLTTNGSGILSWSNPAAGTVTSVAGTAPIVSSGGTTPSISITQATTSSDGYLSSADWNTFNGKSPAAGSTSLTTVGTIISGTWNGSVIGVPYGGTGTNNGSITGTSALTFAAGGTNQNVTLTPSGTGNTILGGNVGIGTTSPSAKLEVSSGAANTSGLKFTNFNSASPTGAGTAVGVDASGNLIAVATGTGSVTSVSVVSANGLGGSVATQSTTPAITLTTSVTGVVKGNGTAFSAADSADITTALGYTPVNKTGDSMGGSLTFAANTGGVYTAGSGPNTVTVQGPSGAIGTSYVMRLPTAQGAASTFLQNDGAGNLSWTVPSGISPVGSTLNSAQIWVGNASNQATAVAMSGDGSLSNAGALTINKVNGVAYPSGPSTNTFPLVTGANTVTYTATSSDTFLQYALLVGRSGGQTLTGGTAANNSLTLDSTSNATKGFINLAPNGGNVGIGTTSPGAALDVKGAIRLSGLTSGYTGFQPAAAAGSTVWTLPSVDGAANQVLTTNGSGILSWSNPAAGTVTSVAGTAPIVSSGGTTPSISITQATTSTDGYLSSTDWNTFNNKSPAAGSSNITTVGTITSGTWNGSIIGVLYGGTGTNNGSITGTGALTFAAGGTNQNVTLNPSGTGYTLLNGNVGVGTSSPSSRLDVVTSGPSVLSLKNSTAQDLDYGRNAQINFSGVTSGGTTVNVAQIQSSQNADNTKGFNTSQQAGRLSLSVSGYSGGMSEVLKLDPTGVYTHANLPVVINTSATTGTRLGDNLLVIRGNPTGTTGNFLKFSGNTFNIGNVGNGGVDIVTSAGTLIHADAGGFVGIGTTVPGAMLDVKGAIRLTGSTSGYTGFQPAAAAGSTVWTLPTADGTANQVLTTNGSGILSWSNPAAGTVTSVAGTAPIVSSGGTTPSISITQATTSTDGYLSSADWNTFNGKSPAAGSASLTTVGTITSGTWNGSVIGVPYGGTGTSNGSITGTGALVFAAGGTNENVSLTPSGTGYTLLNGNVGIRTSAPSQALDVNGAAKVAGNLLIGTTSSPVSNGSPGQLVATGYGVYPYTTLVAGAPSTNSTTQTGLTYTNSFSADGSTTQVMAGIASIPAITNSGTGGASQVGSYGIYSAPLILSSTAASRIYSNGALAVASRTSANDMSNNSGNYLFGGQFSVSHGIDLPTTALTGGMYGALGQATNFSGTVTAQAGVFASIDVASLATAKASTTTSAYEFYGQRFNVGSTGGGPGTVTNGYGIYLAGPVVGTTGTLSNYYGVYIDTASVTGTLSRRYGLYQADANASNYYAGNVGIGTMSPGAPLDVKGAIRLSGSTSGYTGFQPAAAAGSTVWTLPAADGAANQVLTTNGSGVLSWSNPAAGTVTSVTGTAPIVSSGGSTPAISITQATTSTNGYLSSTDWNTFNGKAPLASPTFTGVPAGPTAAVNTNTTQLATTAFVLGQASSTSPVMDGTAAVGTGTTFARADHVHPSDTSRAPAAGSSSITTVGTITTGTWNGSVVGVAYGGTGTSTGSITGTGALTFAAGGTNQNVTLTPSGTGYTLLNGNVGIGTTTPSAKLHVAGTLLANDLQVPNTSGSSESAGGAALQRRWRLASVSTDTMQELGQWFDTEGTVQILVAVSSETSGNSGTNLYLVQAGYAQYSTSWQNVVPFSVGLGHGDSTSGFNLLVAQTASYTYKIAIGVPAGKAAKALQVTATELKGGMTFTDNSATAAVAYSSAGDVYSQNQILVGGNVGIRTSTPGAPLDVKGAIRLSGSTSGYTGFQPAAAAGSTVWTLPTADGSANQVLTTNGAGVLGWSTPAGAGVTSVTGTAPIVSSGGSTPAISITQATTSTNGYLSSTDWNTFNGKAPLASPTFTGVPAAPTAAANTNTTQLATTAFVLGQASSTSPVMDGTAAVGTGTTFARADHVHPSDTSRAPAAGSSSITTLGTITSGTWNGSVIGVAYGGTGTTTGSITGTGALTFAAGGTNQNVTLTPSGTGYTLLNGNVGIGTTAPIAKFEVQGGSAATNGSYAALFGKTRNATNTQMYLFNDVGGLWTDTNGGAAWRGVHFSSPTITDPSGGANVFPRLMMYAEYDTLTAPTYRQWVIDAGNDTATSRHQLIFRTGGSVNRMTIDGSGNVGVGTTAPTTLLEVAGTVSANTLQSRSSTSSLVINTLNTSAGNGSVYFNSPAGISFEVAPLASSANWLRVFPGAGTSAPLIDAPQNYGMSLGGAGAARHLTITGTGNVGIGTTSPGALLDVKGAIRLSGSTSGYTGFQPAAAAGSTVWTLPAADGSANQVLTTNGAGVLGWSTPAGAGVTSVTGTAPIVSSGGSTPAISITQATTSTNGYLSSTDWNTFNGKAPLASPTFTGVPAAPTAAANTNTTQIATTAFVLGQASSTSPVMNGTAAVGTGTTFARADHVHPTDTSRSPLAGSASITTLGTISSGTWNGSVVGVAYGGTGTSTGSITGTGALTFAAGGTNQNVTLTPSGTGYTLLNGNVGIGNAAPGAPLDVKGAIRLSGSTSGYTGFQPAAAAGSTVWTLPAADGTANQVLTTNGSGVLSWSTPGGSFVSSVTGTAPIVSSGGTTPAISITQATTSTNGYLSSTDWNTFNGKAPLASPTFTGVPAAPTAAANTNTTQIATTAFVLGQASSTSPVMNGTAAVGTGTTFARADHVHPTDTSRSPLAGSASITTLGTISSGTWNGSVVGVAYGGTGTSTGSITGTGALTFAAGGTNQDITLTPSGTGDTLLGGKVGLGTAIPAQNIHVHVPSASDVGFRLSNSTFTTGMTMYISNASSAGYIGTTESTLNFGIFAGANTRMTVSAATGFVGIGTTSPRAMLDVSGTLLVKPAVLNATSAIDFLTGNKQYTNSACGAFQLNNLKDGGEYLFVVKGSSTNTCSFTAFSDAGVTALTVHLPPDHGPSISAKHTLYNLTVVGTDVYMAWSPGL